MLVKPLIRRHHDAARLPVDALHLLPLLPQHRITLPAENNHMGAGAMLVSLLVSTDWEFRNMRAHGLAGEVELHVGAALAALAVVGELDRMRVGHEVGRHEETPGHFTLAAEVTFGGRIEAVE